MMVAQFDTVKNCVTSGGSGGTPSQILRENLKNAGIEPPPYPNAVHHIVAVGSDKSKSTCELLKEYGIDLDSTANGVFLPYKKNEFVTTEAMHSGGHLDSYHKHVYDRISDVVEMAEDRGHSDVQIRNLICERLQYLKKELLNGNLKIHN